MGKLVNVVLPGGRVVSVPEESAPAQDSPAMRRQTPEEGTAAITAATNKERSAGGAEAGKALLEGFGDTVSFGLLGKAHGLMDPDYARNEGIRGTEQAGARTVGDVLGLVAPTGWLGAGGKAVGLAPRLAAGAGERVAARVGEGFVGKAAGRVAEGGILGIGSHVEASNVTGDPLTVEGTIHAAGFGALLNVAAGALSDRVLSGTKAAQAGIDADKAAATTAEAKAAEAVKSAEQGAKYESPPPSWNEVRAAHKAGESVAAKTNKAVIKEHASYQTFLNEEVNDRLKTDVSATVNEIRSYFAPHGSTPPAVSGGAAVRKPGLNSKFDVSDSVPGLPSTADDVVDGMETTISARELHRRGYTQTKGVGDDPVKLDKAHTAIKEGQKEPVTISVSPDGRYHVDDGRHRIKAAIDQGANIKVKWERGSSGVDEAATGIPGEVPAGRRVQWNADGKAIVSQERFVRQPMSDEVRDFLREIEEQKSKALKLWGGGRDVTKGRWAPHDPSIPANREAALDELKGIKMKVEARFPQASANFKPLPDRPRGLIEYEAVDLPADLTSFGKMHPEQVAKFARAAEQNPATTEAFGRMMDDLGLAKTGNIVEDVQGVQKALSNYNTLTAKVAAEAAVAKAAKAAGEAGEDGTILPFIRKTSKQMAKYAAARKADVGGWMGAATRTAAGAAVGYALDGAEGALITSAMMNGKMGVRGKLREVVAKYGTRAGNTIGRLAPITSYLGAKFPSGEPDTERDTRKQTVNRIGDVVNAALVAPDSMFNAVQGMMGHESDVAWKMHAHINDSLKYLAMVAPKDPGLDISFTGSHWTPSYQDVVRFAHTFEAVTNPMAAIERALQGDGHPAATDALWDRYPAMMSEVATEVAVMAPQLERVSYEGGGSFRDLFRVPVTGLQQPAVALALQSLYLPSPDEVQGGTGGGQSQHPTGRPPAVQSKVAGSSVSGLIS